MIDYQVVFLDGMKVNAAVTENEDCSYTIFINVNLCEEKRINALKHELKHIMNDDFGKIDVQEIEKDSHKEAII